MDLGLVRNVHESFPRWPPLDFGHQVHHRCNELVVSSLLRTHVHLDTFSDQRNPTLNYSSDGIAVVLPPERNPSANFKRSSHRSIQPRNDNSLRHDLPINSPRPPDPPPSPRPPSTTDRRNCHIRLLPNPRSHRRAHQPPDPHLRSDPLTISPSFRSRT